MFIAFLSSISKVAIVAFLFTFIAIVIELYLISKKEKVKKEKKDVVLPAFTEGTFKPLNNVKNSPLTVKKAAIDRAPHEMSAKYVVGLIGLCAIVFIGVAVSIVLKGSQEEIADQVVLPTGASKPTIIQQASPTLTDAPKNDEVELMTLDDEETSTDKVEIFAQAPSPTSFLLSVAPTKSTTAPTVATPPKSTTPTGGLSTTPTKAAKPTLLKTGTSYNASLIAAVISFALIAFAFMF